MRSCFALLAALAVAANAHGTTVISDDFDTDTFADYFGVGAADGTVEFAFDYGAAGIPAAPGSSGSTLGLRMTANDTAGASDAVTLHHNTFVSAPSYVLSVDVYMGVTGTGGTTEFGHVGVAGDGVTVNSLFLPISGSGHFLAFTGEGGSSSDFRHSRPAAIGGLTNTGDPSYLNSDNSTNASADTYQQIFAGGDFPGSPGNRWTTLEITVSESAGEIFYAFDGTRIIRNEFSDSDGGQVSLGYADLFSSVAAPFQSQFVVYDNLTVTVIPEPTAALLAGLGCVALVRRRR